MTLEFNAKVSKSYFKELEKKRVIKVLPTIEGLVGRATYIDASYVDPAGQKHKQLGFANSFQKGLYRYRKTDTLVTITIAVKDYIPYPINPQLKFPAQQILSAEEWQAKTQAGITPKVEKWHLQHLKDMGYNAIEYYQGNLFIRVLLDNAVYKFVAVRIGAENPTKTM